jgi:hypothetical protein
VGILLKNVQNKVLSCLKFICAVKNFLAFLIFMALGHLILLVSGPNGVDLIDVVATLLESIVEVLHFTKHT